MHYSLLVRGGGHILNLKQPQEPYLGRHIKKDKGGGREKGRFLGEGGGRGLET